MHISASFVVFVFSYSLSNIVTAKSPSSRAHHLQDNIAKEMSVMGIFYL